MSKEHSGGGPQRLGFEYDAGEGGAVAVGWVAFDFERLDSVGDLLRECVLKERPLEPVVRELLAQCEEEVRGEVVSRVLEYVIAAERPRLAAYQLAFASGMDITLGLSGPEIARCFGDSKQAFFQGVERLRVELGLRKTATMRDEGARENMSRANYRATSVAANATAGAVAKSGKKGKGK